MKHFISKRSDSADSESGTGESTVSRRDFVRASLVLGGGLMISVYGCGPNGEEVVPTVAGGLFAPNAFVRIDANGDVIITSKHLEMGQGAYTGLATIVAEELDADWTKVRVEGAGADDKKYGNSVIGGLQGTGGSSAIANSYEQHRKAGATARAMLIAAAAKQWKVPASELVTEPGIVVHAASSRRATYGSLAGAAAGITVPANVPLKDPRTFRYIGKEKGTPRVDIVAKTNGSATFTQDVQLKGMLTTVVAHAPRFGATVKSFDAAKAKAVAGVTDVVQIPTGVAVVAENFWAAKQGRDALVVQWDDANAVKTGSAEIMESFRTLAGTKGMMIRNDGNAEQAIAGAAKTVEATYEFPYLAHASMEPLNCVVELRKDGATVWNSNQFPTVDQAAVAKVLGLKQEQVTMTTLFAGGSFGRRANPKSDYVVEAATIAKAIDGRAPVKMVWTREDDISAGYFRPAILHSLKGGLDASGNATAWWQRVVGQNMVAGTMFESPDGKDASLYEGAADHVYSMSSVYLDAHFPKVAVPVQWWRSVGHTHTAFAVEAFIDEMARAGGRDPLEFRRTMLAKDPRRLGVLNLAAERAGWGGPLPSGRARGIAVHKSFDSYVAQVAEVSLEGGVPRVHKVTCAVDCGIVINPDIVRSQMEGAIAFGLGAALYGKVDIEGGRVVSNNFDRYRVLRQREMPVVDVHIVPSTEKPTGVGEPGTPPIAPAVANALLALTGKPTRSLPFVA
ncbi:MAG TPA: xanthine dehydrogenase family protein molybdopterin-binding subunit [Gemmatimonadaceae bacterium]|nr:xanthine dehydrogenase family protein molybdopterin-binding subunit [Gemmatimonadaceae bacterium]